MAYEKGKPEPGIKAKLLDDRVRGNNDFIQPAINNEHNFVDADANNQSGDHTQGSARCFSQATAPATRIDGSSFLSTDLGSLWVDTDDNAMYILTAIAPTWTPVSTEVIATLLAGNRIFAGIVSVTGNFNVNSSKFSVNATTGNSTVAGTLDVAGDIDPTSYGTGSGGFKDDDTMADNSATAVASQQSIKAYVGTEIAANTHALGSWVTSPSGYATSVTASTDGFVVAMYDGAGDVTLQGFSPVATVRQWAATQGLSDKKVSIMFPVKSGDTWKVTSSSARYWIPLGL